MDRVQSFLHIYFGTLGIIMGRFIEISMIGAFVHTFQGPQSKRGLLLMSARVVSSSSNSASLAHSMTCKAFSNLRLQRTNTLWVQINWV